ncbi:MAG: protein kinase [Deltaproteobacteria bacterium]|nr:protein kinase [Deltaproteobacteria bacterium]
MERAILQTDADRYVIVEYLAEGGMGAIYLGKKVGMGGFEKEVVLKQLLPEFTSQQEFIDLFLREAKLSASLDHANIIHTIDLVAAGSDYFIVMEYVRGGDLRTLLRRIKRRHRQLDAAAAMFIAREVLSALGYAHDKKSSDGQPLKLIHRDVSPSNIMVSGAGEVKLADFGIAKASTHKSVFYRVKGKVGYMSPEQARADRPLDHRSDLYSAAVCLYEMLSGERLFVADLLTTPDQIYGQPVPLLEGETRMPRGIDDVMRRALAVEPDERYQTAAEFQDALVQVAFQNGMLMGAPDLAAHLVETCGNDPSRWNREEDADAEPEGGTQVLTEDSRSLSGVALTSVMTSLAGHAGRAGEDGAPRRERSESAAGRPPGARRDGGGAGWSPHAEGQSQPDFDATDVMDFGEEPPASSGDALPLFPTTSSSGPPRSGADSQEGVSQDWSHEDDTTIAFSTTRQAKALPRKPAASEELVEVSADLGRRTPPASARDAAPFEFEEHTRQLRGGVAAASRTEERPHQPERPPERAAAEVAPLPLTRRAAPRRPAESVELTDAGPAPVRVPRHGGRSRPLLGGLRTALGRPSRGALLAGALLLLALAGSIVVAVGLSGPSLVEPRRTAPDSGTTLAAHAPQRPRADAQAAADRGPDGTRATDLGAPDLRADARPSDSRPRPTASGGLVTVESIPAGADVFLDGIKQCRATCTVEGLDPKRVYLLSVRRPGYVSWSELVDLRGRPQPRRRITLTAEPDARRVGYVVVRSNLPADVYVNGRAIGRVSTEGRIPLRPGQYELTLAHPRRRKRVTFVTVVQRQKTTRTRWIKL